MFRLTLLFLLLLSPYALSAKPLTIEALTDPRGMTRARISPDGSKVAAVIFNGTNHGLLLIDTKTRAAKSIYTGHRDSEGFWNYTKAPREIMWVGNDMIAADFGMVAAVMDLNGKILREIGESIIGYAERENPHSTKLLVYTDEEDNEIAIVDVLTGKKRKLSYPSGKPVQFAFDRAGELRAVSLLNSPFWKEVVTISQWYRPSASEEWIKLEEHPLADERWSPVYVQDKGKLVVNSRVGRDTYALFEYDVATRQHGDMLAGHPTQDILDVQGVDQAAFKYVTTSGMIPQQVWFDANWEAMQRSVDAVLPNRFNLISGALDKMVLIHSYSDKDPGTYYLLDVQAKTLGVVGYAQTSVADAEVPPVSLYKYRATDGLEIPAFRTKPLGSAGPAPMVVMVHGGPVVRDHWKWTDEVHLLATHGYVVFQPQFRGSSGFGKKFEELGYRQWGRAMQDDITQGVRQLIKDGVADPNRICIVGWSYGGYAALWGLVQTPELYRCGVSGAGVADISYMLSDYSDTNETKEGRLMMVKLVGLKSDAASFDAVSPLKQAARIKAPVMLVHGDLDRRVPIAHGRKMRDALEDSGQKVEWLTFENEGHGLRYTKSQKRYYESLLNFLHKHIGGMAPRVSEPKPEKKP